MKRSFFAAIALVGCSIAVLVLFFFWRAEAMQSEGDAERLVRLAVSVWDAEGNPVTDLSEEDFTILEQGESQKIAQFIKPTAPLQIVLLIDASGSMARVFGRVQIGLLEFVSSMGLYDEVAVISFAGMPRLETDFSFNSDRVKQSLRALRVAQDRVEMTRLYDACKPVLDRLGDAGQNFRKALVLVTDGFDRGSRALDRKSSLRLAHRKRIPFFVFQMQGRESSYLRELAEATGGRFYRADKFFEKHLQDVAQHVRYHYVLGYMSSASPSKAKSVSLQVETSRTGLRVVAPEDYRVPPQS